MKAWLGRAAFAAIVVFGAARADAQITTVMDPPKRVDPKQQAAAKREEVVQDSIARVTMTGMKEWVDSAATALAVRPDTTAAPASNSVSSAAQAQQPPQRTDSTTAARNRQAAPTEFRDGARAPNTGTPVPTVALVGAVLVLLGVALRARPRRTEVRVPRR
jgi:cobalamin biosynthesis Mg chelatase CobN